MAENFDHTAQPTDDNSNNNDHDDHDNLLSHIVPPSHILPDGRHIQLPPPSALERSAFFERAVAFHHLIAGDNEKKKKRKIGTSNGNSNSNGGKKRQTEEDGGHGDDDASTASRGVGGKRRKKSDAPYVHPLAIASARLRAKGIDELSKAINLGGLVIGGEYFSLSNIVNQQARSSGGSGGSGVIKTNDKDTTSGDAVKTTKTAAADGSTKSITADNETSYALVDDAILLDQRLRSEYVLQRRQSQYTHASQVLNRHTKRLSTSLSVMRIIDNRLQSLRKRWRLVAPEHGTRTVGPVRPREVVAIDVEVYDRLGGGSSYANSNNNNNGDDGGAQLGRIARRVPRFATLELDDDYNIVGGVKSLRKKVTNIMDGLKKVNDDTDNDNDDSEGENTTTVVAAMEIEDATTLHNTTAKTKTKALPFAVADPTLGKIDADFDPNKVPLLTLLFEIEKPSTGFVERATLSSSSFLTDNGGKGEGEKMKKHLHPDERVIEALQHSLFCASLFESMRSEIIPSTSPSTSSIATNATTTLSTSLHQQRQRSVAWLSSEMEESYLPPPSSMAGEVTNQTRDTRLLCVIHCHEGEVKIQLDDEYSLTVKLIEAGTAAAAGSSSDNTEDDQTMKVDNDNSSSSSGSQSPTQLKTLCRALLLHSQSLYHEHCMKIRTGNGLQKKKEEPPLGFARMKKQIKQPSPHILQRCVGLGCKFIFEKKIRMVLRVSLLFT